MTNADRQALLHIARVSIAAEVGAGPQVNIPLHGELTRPAGAFVTLYHAGELRGCIGEIETADPVGRVVGRCAAAACSRDPRFLAVTPLELPDLGIELSILGPLEPLTRLDEIEIGRHGLVVQMGRRRGLLLPQVATEWQWDALTLVEQTCAKAGVSYDAWKAGATLLRFEAEVFREP